MSLLIHRKDPVQRLVLVITADVGCSMFQYGFGKSDKQKHIKFFKSEFANWIFDQKTGVTLSWGKKKSDDIVVAPVPQIADIEITTICAGPNGRVCPMCYKSNTSLGEYMSFDTYKRIIDKMPWLAQVALGADAQGTSNPDTLKIIEYTRNIGIVPNITLADVSNETAIELAKFVGAVAVSVYEHAGVDIAYNSVQRLVNAGIKQVNLHYCISDRTIDSAFDVVNDIVSDERLRGVNAIVFLGIKNKGRGAKHKHVSTEKYRDLVNYCNKSNIKFGFDSCSAGMYLKTFNSNEERNRAMMYVEPCESTCISSYINVRGDFFPCSFTEGEKSWSVGLSVLDAENFVDVWNHPKTQEFRSLLLNNCDENSCRNCPVHVVLGNDMRCGEFKDELIEVKVDYA